MAHEEALKSTTYVTGADLSAAQYKLVKMDSNGHIIAIAAATDQPIGILQNKPTSGQNGTVAYSGISKMVCSAAIATDSLIGASADGRAAPNPAGASGIYLIGTARTSTANANEIFSVQFNTAGIPPKA